MLMALKVYSDETYVRTTKSSCVVISDTMFYWTIALLFLLGRLEGVSSKCTGGQVLVKCVSGCVRGCNFGIRPLCLIPDSCTRGCECPTSLPITTFDENNQVKCITEEDCCEGDLIPGCQPNACSPRCDPPKEPIFCTQECRLGCQCPPSKPIQIHGKDGSLKCITEDMCPQCTGGQVFKLCGSACTPTCEDPAPACTEQCVTRCECPPNKPIWDAGKCITKDTCPQCKGGQVFKNCGSACTRTCDNPNPICTKQCVRTCECPAATPLWDGESCVTKDECPDCQGGQVFNLCGSACTLTCEDPYPFCTLQCVARCECPNSKPIWHNGMCITKQMCPVCTGGRVFRQCGSACTPTCDNPNPICTKQCVPRCQCPANAPLWNGNKCITKYMCPECTGGRVFRTCGSACTPTCENPFPICILVCVARCQCPPEKPLWDGEKCISQEMCKNCPGGQIFKFCGSACTRTCKNPYPICTKQCVARCECPTNKPLWNGVQCITEEQCEKCSGGRVFQVCGSACTRTCEVPNPVCTKQCVARCQCPHSKPFWDGMQCIDQDDCDCRLPPDKGPCVIHTMRWYYNTDHMRCEQFSYGGCPGNANNFVSEKDCYKKCDQSGCKYIDCSMSYCPAGVKLKRGCTHRKCQCDCPCKKMKCPYGYECVAVRNSNCKKPPCPYIGKCVEKVCKYGSPLPDASCGLFYKCPEGYHCKQNSKKEYVCCPDDICHLLPDSGCGKRNNMRWFYDPASQSCKLFRYAGRGGNKNNFRTKRACLKKCLPKGCKPLKCNIICQFGYEEDKKGCEICRCKNPCSGVKCDQDEVVRVRVFPCLIPPCPTGCICEPSPCMLPKVPGPCRGSFPRYYFNSATKQCEPFTYGGCGGNANNFETLKECYTVCGRFAICPIVDYCFTRCPYGYRPNDKGCMICDCHDPCHGVGCPKNQVCQPLQVHCVTSPCPPAVATCVPKKCNLGLPLQDGNNGDFCCSAKMPCPSGYECIEDVCCAQDVCRLPPNSGPCIDYKHYYYYNYLSGKCTKFLYGGCGGNKNRFKSLAKCKATCSGVCPPVKCTLYCPEGFARDKYGCEICKCN